MMILLIMLKFRQWTGNNGPTMSPSIKGGSRISGKGVQCVCVWGGGGGGHTLLILSHFF